MIRGFLALALLLSALVLPVRASAGTTLRWRSFEAGLKEARATGRPLLVDVFTDWCRWCKVMDREVYAREDVRQFVSQHFVPVKLDAEGDRTAPYAGSTLTESAVARRFGINSYPTTMFLRRDGTHLVNVPGYWPPEKFLLVLRFIAEGRYERGDDFDAYLRQPPGGR